MSKVSGTPVQSARALSPVKSSGKSTGKSSKRKSASSLGGRQVEKNATAPTPKQIARTQQEIYKQSLRKQSVYMNQKQIRLLTQHSPEAREGILKVVHKGVTRAHREIKNAASEISDYKKYRSLKPDVGEMARRKTKAKRAAKRTSQRLDFKDMPATQKQEAKKWADRLPLSYKGIGVPPSNNPLPEGCRLLTDSEVPQCLAMFYDDQSGLLQTPSGCKALLMKEGDNIVLAFGGTEGGSKATTGRTHTIQADVVQRVGGYSTMYHDACGITRLLLQQHPEANIQIFGHSLGGGQAQYALATNIEGNEDRLTCWAFNSAGLSASTLGSIQDRRIEASKDLIYNVRVEGDPVSPGSATGDLLKGALLGRSWTIHRPEAKAIEGDAHRVLFLRQTLDTSLDDE